MIRLAQSYLVSLGEFEQVHYTDYPKAECGEVLCKEMEIERKSLPLSSLLDRCLLLDGVAGLRLRSDVHPMKV